MRQLLIGKDAEGKPFFLDSSGFTKHCVVFGATGSGKTVLCKNIIEEASINRIPILAIDPKGDIGCLAIRASNFGFRPFSDVEAKLLGKPPDTYAIELASEYSSKFHESGREENDLSRFVEDTDVRIYTPRSQNGLPVSMSPRLTPPKGFDKTILGEPSLALDLLELKASNLLHLAGYGEDSKVQRSLISQILEEEWTKSNEVTLEKLIELVTSPPFEKLGMLPLDQAIGRRERSELSKRLNVLLTDAGAKAWFIGQPPDFDKWFRRTDEKTPVCIVDLRAIPTEDGKQVFVEYLLQELYYWLTRQEGTQTLQYLLYFDEIRGYCPPVREPPSKKILMHLIRVSRAFGLGIVMATQNPVDVDYKVISNANSRFIGNLSTRQDIDRVKTGLGLGPEAFKIISTLKMREFYYQIFDRGRSGLLTPGWLMSYHRGPLEPREIKQLTMKPSPEAEAARVLPMLVADTVFMREVERKRAKKGILSSSGENIEFGKIFYIPYSDFTFRYSAQKGFLTKRTTLMEKRSVLLALREVDLEFSPSLLEEIPQLVQAELDPNASIPGVEAIILVQERLHELRQLLSDHDRQLENLRARKTPMKNDDNSNSLKSQIQHVENARSSRWKIFADGLSIPHRTDPYSLELLRGGIFYIPYFIVKLSRSGESRFIVWDRRGRESDAMTDELVKNAGFRSLIESRASS